MGPMSAAASWRREKEAITYQSSVLSRRLFRGQSCLLRQPRAHSILSYILTMLSIRSTVALSSGKINSSLSCP